MRHPVSSDVASSAVPLSVVRSAARIAFVHCWLDKPRIKGRLANAQAAGVHERGSRVSTGQSKEAVLRCIMHAHSINGHEPHMIIRVLQAGVVCSHSGYSAVHKWASWFYPLAASENNLELGEIVMLTIESNFTRTTIFIITTTSQEY